MKNVANGGGLSLFERGKRRRLKVSKRKKVKEGLRVSTREAEYPDQKPAMPFSFMMSWVICAVDGAFEA